MSEEDSHRLKIKKAWDIALQGGKSIPMNAFMLYMSGNSIQIFSILITVMLFWNSFKAIMAVNPTFERLGIQTGPLHSLGEFLDPQKNPLLLPKITYVTMQGGNLMLGVWKCAAMGLLPTATSDWLAFMEAKTIMEQSYMNLLSP